MLVLPSCLPMYGYNARWAIHELQTKTYKTKQIGKENKGDKIHCRRRVLYKFVSES